MVGIFKKEQHFIKGKASWFRARQANKFDKWSVQLHPIKEDLDKVRDWQAEGVKNVIKKDDDGYFLTFTRPIKKETRTGKVLVFRPPYVINDKGEPFDGNVGNGSDVTLEIELYEHPVPNTDKKAKAARWVGARIDNLIPFESSDYKPDEYEVVEKVLEQPAPLWN